MGTRYFTFIFLLFSNILFVASGECPCEDPSLCEPIARPPGKEFFMFSLEPNVWRKYDWSKVTTIALFRPWDDELMCEAHKRGVRVVFEADFPVEELSSKEARAKWVQNLTDEALARHADGVNIDFESPIAKRSREVTLLTTLVNETATALRSAIKNAQISFDVPWSPNCTYGRCYDVEALSKVVDFLVVMAYDESGGLIAKANSPLNQTEAGIKEYLSLRIGPEKLVLGLPWYGYDYPCLELINDRICMIKPGAASRSMEYAEIEDLIVSRASFGPQKDEDSESYFFNYEDSVGAKHQVWFGNPDSLNLKYNFAANENLNGVAIWNADFLDYSDLPRAEFERKKMWDALHH